MIGRYFDSSPNTCICLQGLLFLRHLFPDIAMDFTRQRHFHKNITMSSFKSSGNIQKKESGPYGCLIRIHYFCEFTQNNISDTTSFFLLKKSSVHVITQGLILKSVMKSVWWKCFCFVLSSHFKVNLISVVVYPSTGKWRFMLESIEWDEKKVQWQILFKTVMHKHLWIDGGISQNY